MSRLAIELKPGVFLSDIGSRVREKLWKKISLEWGLDAIMIYSSNTEQSYRICINGSPKKQVVNLDGIQLLSNPSRK